MSATQAGHREDSDLSDAKASRSLGEAFSLATGAGLATMDSWFTAAQRTAPLLDDPDRLIRMIEIVLATANIVESAVQIASLARKVKSKLEILSSIGARVAELQQSARDDEEPFSEISHIDFRQFLGNLALTRRPSIFLLENGVLSAVWDNPKGELVSLQFLGNSSIQYVLFRQEENSKDLTSIAGVDDFARVLAKLDNFKHVI
jgi:hypothetical protein